MDDRDAQSEEMALVLSKVSAQFDDLQWANVIDPTSTTTLVEDPADDGLCSRCRRLQQEAQLQTKLQLNRLYTSGYADVNLETIQRRSIDEKCSLYLQFYEIIASISRLSLSTSSPWECHEFNLTCDSLVLYEVVPYEVVPYLKINFERYLRPLHFIPIQGANNTSFYFSRIIDPRCPDLDLMRHWISCCQGNHERICTSGKVRPDRLRLIDCKTRRLVIADPSQQYVCLSYLWGTRAIDNTKTFKTILPDVVPKTIEDAMYVAIELSIPYIWIDRYCIDPEEEHDVIRNMNRIYEGAEVTIIAAAGEDPHYGLPGIRGTPRSEQLILEVGGQTFVGVEALYHGIMHSKWATRAWTV